MAVGRRSCIVICILIFILGSVLSATAQSIIWLILARALQGVGAGGMDIMFSIVITEMVPLAKLANYVSFLQLAAGAGVVWGQLIGAVIVQHSSWRYVFWINVPLAGIPLIILPMLIRKHDSSPSETLLGQLKSMDWPGIVLVTGSLVAMLYALFSGGILAPWSSGQILAPLLIGFAGLCIFVLHEMFLAGKYFKAAPLIPMRLFNNRSAAAAFTIVLVHGIVISTIVYDYTIYLFIIGGVDLIGLAVRSLPTAIIPLGSAGVASVLITKAGSFKWFNVAGLCILLIGMAMLHTLKGTSPLGDQVGFQVIYSIGLGILFPARAMAAVVSQERKSDHPQAAALVSIGFNLGQTFGLAVGSAILQNAWNVALDKAVTEGTVPAEHLITGSDIEASFEIIKELPVTLRDKYREIAAISTGQIWLVMAVLTGMTLILALFSKNLRFGDAAVAGSSRLDDSDSEDRLIQEEMQKMEGKESVKKLELYIARW
ncbi:major facilitator superfamily domain-containing protein [Coniochaeta sp. 2T2.1]|nr:major facilitator superfamily domain-containing protein [Coniochaeta sp. 2T2.1]